MPPKVFIFDLDETLTESRTPIGKETALLISKLLEKAKVAVTSGASFAQFKKQLLAGLPSKEHFSELFILPTNGAELWEFDAKAKDWRRLYSYPMPEAVKERVKTAIVALAGIPIAESSKYIDDLGTQVTYSMLGIDAPIEEKKEIRPG